VLARPFRPEEIAIVESSLARLGSQYQSQSELAAPLLDVGESKSDPQLEPAILAAWPMIANELINNDEFMSV